MNRKLIITVLFLLIATVSYSQNNQRKWGLSAPILSTEPSKDIALSRCISKSNMVLFWTHLYFDKNNDVTPNQDVFENYIWSVKQNLDIIFMPKRKLALIQDLD